MRRFISLVINVALYLGIGYGGSRFLKAIGVESSLTYGIIVGIEFVVAYVYAYISAMALGTLYYLDD